MSSANRTVRPSPNRLLTAKVIYAAMQILKQKGGTLSSEAVVLEIGNTITFDEWQQERIGRTRRTRWQSTLHSHTALCVKAGMLVKNRGMWTLTPTGENALDGFDEVRLLEEIEKVISRLTLAGIRRWWHSLGVVSKCTVLGFLVGIVGLSGWVFGIMEYVEKRQLYRKQTELATARITALNELHPTVVKLEKVEIMAWLSDPGEPFVNLLFRNISDLPARHFRVEIRLSFKSNLPEGPDTSEGYSKIEGHLAYHENYAIAANSQDLVPVAPVREIRERFEKEYPEEKFLTIVANKEDFDLGKYHDETYGMNSEVSINYLAIAFDYSYVSVFGEPTKHRKVGYVVSEVYAVKYKSDPEDDENGSKSDDPSEDGLRRPLKE